MDGVISSLYITAIFSARNNNNEQAGAMASNMELPKLKTSKRASCGEKSSRSRPRSSTRRTTVKKRQHIAAPLNDTTIASSSKADAILEDDNIPGKVQALTRLMPPKDKCLFWWATVAAVRIRTLFEATKNIIREGVLVVSPNGIELQEYDNTKVMVVFFRMRRANLEQYGEYYCKETMSIPLSIDEFYKGVKCINQSDVVGLCVTQESMNSSHPSLDLHIMHPTHGYSYQHSCRLLHEEFMHIDTVHLQDNAKFYAHLNIRSTFFKRYLNDCLPHGKNLKFLFRYDDNLQAFCAHLIPCDSDIGMSTMRLRLISENADGYDRDQIARVSEENAPKYSIANLLLFTKATPLSHSVEILLSHEFPLVVKYSIGDLGEIRFCLAPVFSEQERDDYLSHEVREGGDDDKKQEAEEAEEEDVVMAPGVRPMDAPTSPAGSVHSEVRRVAECLPASPALPALPAPSLQHHHQPVLECAEESHDSIAAAPNSVMAMVPSEKKTTTKKRRRRRRGEKEKRNGAREVAPEGQSAVTPKRMKTVSHQAIGQAVDTQPPGDDRVTATHETAPR